MATTISIIDNMTYPANVETEKGILGAIMLDNDLYLDASARLTCDDFFLESHKTIYRFMSDMLNDGQVVDIYTLGNALRDFKELETIGGVAYLASLTEGLPRRLSIESWVGVVKDKSLHRQIIDVSNFAVVQSADGQDSPLDVLNLLEHRMHEIGQKTIVRGLTSTSDIITSAFPSVDEFFHPREILGVDTHYVDINRLTGGFQKQDLIVVAARPSMGKTAFAINVGQKVAILGGLSVSIFSLEMSKESLLSRMISTQSMVPLQRIKTGTVLPEERESIYQAIEDLAGAKLFIDDTPSISLAELRAKALRQKRSPVGLDLIIVDYIQLMSAVQAGSRHRPENRTQEVSAIPRGLKAIAKELDVPVVALSQLSRASEQRDDKRPFLSDLRESGSIEQDADVVAFIHRESYYKRDENGEEDPTTRNKAEIILAKQRNGPTNTVHLTYRGDICAFMDLSHRLLSPNYDCD
jgi:replicative DNA helicase